MIRFFLMTRRSLTNVIVPVRPGAKLMVVPQEAYLMASRSEQAVTEHAPSSVSTNELTSSICPESGGVTNGVSVGTVGVTDRINEGFRVGATVRRTAGVTA